MAAPSPRRVGSQTSKTRAALLDAAQQVMLDDGYAAVTYRSMAERAGVTPGLVQYYFPTLDDMFLALLRRRADQTHERLLAELETRVNEPLRITWEHSSDETTAALLTEFMALANHRKVVRAAILEVIERTRRAQLEVLKARWDEYRDHSDRLSPEALLFLLHNIPKMIQLEEAVGLSTAHQEILRFVQRRLDGVEPDREVSKPRPATPTKGRRSSRAARRG
jgi:AcrR family transcriptional regulator